MASKYVARAASTRYIFVEMADCFTFVGCPVSQSALEEPETKQVAYYDSNDGDGKGAAAAATPATIIPPKSQSPTNSRGSGSNRQKQQSPSPIQKTVAPPTTHLPILIIPGFMSSGLEIKASSTRPDWEGKRIWLNLGSLGLSSMYFGSAQRENNDDDNNTNNNNDDKDQQQEMNQKQRQQQSYKSSWLQHMLLSDSDLCTDPEGVQVRAIAGLEGVDYLTPGVFTSHVSYVFGPVIEALKLSGGYAAGVNLQAAPYDWRLPPLALEQRDQYFSRTIMQVEELYRNSHKTPVVLLGHSLGTKTAHYFLNFCLQKKGQPWIDKHVHTYLPVGAPHLGAPKALRSLIAGDKMGLDAFLSDEEALALGRGIGSGAWLFPQQLPAGAPSSVYVKPHGVLEITMNSGAPLDAHDLVSKRTALSKPNRYQLIVSYGREGGGSGGDKTNIRQLHTSFVPTISASSASDQVMFTDKLSFATHPNSKDAASYGRLRFFLQEPGLAVAKEEKEEQKSCCSCICCILKWITCCCIFDYAYRLVRWILCGLMRGVALSADALTSGVGGGTNLAFSLGNVDIPPAVWQGETVTQEVRLYHKDDYNKYDRFLCFRVWKQPRVANLQVQIRWIPYKSISKETSVPPLCSPVCQPNQDKQGKKPVLSIGHHSSSFGKKKKQENYQEFAGHDILECEGLVDTIQLIRDVYDNADSLLGPRTKSALEAPPVQRIHAIYGINIPTEVGGVYKRKDECLTQNHLRNLYQLDSKAYMQNQSGFTLKQGLLYETPQTKQVVAGGSQIKTVCGDGTVPYWSLQHCKSWEACQGKQVSVVELDRAEHREILADVRFHQALLEYCRIKKESV